MKEGIGDFITSRTWGEQSLPANQRIACDFSLNILEQVSQNSFRGTLLMVAQRPVYNSSYQSPIFNFFDNSLSFKFSESERLEFSQGVFNSELTSTIAYWIYIIMGIDGDSFSPSGGKEYFRRAEEIVSAASSSGAEVWSSSNKTNKSKFWIINHYNSTQYARLHSAIYKYHRLGLDMLYDNAEEGRKNIIAALKELEQLFNDQPDNMMIPFHSFFDAKADEIVNVFSGASSTQKGEVYRILNRINNTNERKYKKLNE